MKIDKTAKGFRNRLKTIVRRSCRPIATGALVIFAASFAAAQQSPVSPNARTAGNGKNNNSVQKSLVSDEFNSETLGAQWQWQAKPAATSTFPFPAKGVLTMFSVQTPDGFKNLWNLPDLLLQKFPAEEFTATAKLTLAPRFEGEKFGLVVMGTDYSYAGVTYKGGKIYVAQAGAKDAARGSAETENMSYLLNEKTFYLRVKAEKDGLCIFSYSTDGAKFTSLGVPFKLRESGAAGAKIGFFFIRPAKFNDAGAANIDWFRVE